MEKEKGCDADRENVKKTKIKVKSKNYKPAIFRLIFSTHYSYESAMHNKCCKQWGPAFWLKILTFKTWSNSVNVVSIKRYSYTFSYFKDSLVS